MTVPEAIIRALTEQVQHETYNAHTYKTISIEFAQKGLKRLASTFGTQASEELGHAERIITYLQNIGAMFAYPVVPAAELMPQGDGEANHWVTERLGSALILEKTTTRRINALMDLAIELHDNTTQSFLQWFLDEQVTEEFEAQQRLEVSRVTDNPALVDLILG